MLRARYAVSVLVISFWFKLKRPSDCLKVSGDGCTWLSKDTAQSSLLNSSPLFAGILLELLSHVACIRQFKHQTLFATQTQTQRNLIVKPNQKGRICHTALSHWLRNLGYVGSTLHSLTWLHNAGLATFAGCCTFPTILTSPFSLIFSLFPGSMERNWND